MATLIEKIKEADIVVIGTPLWMGDKTSIATKMIERLYGSNHIENEEGHSFYYNKVAGVVVTGNEDGAKHAIASLFFGLSYIGFTVAPESCAYWLGEAGPGPSFIEANGEQHEFTKGQVKKMSHNLYSFARMHRQFQMPAMKE